ncbi:MAG: hypothetical protein BroJett020_02320 [Bacteroidota bacterium]|nr:MAG: hypothetical protein BroJett020_02320 [Bacteroidota bacterium]
MSPRDAQGNVMAVYNISFTSLGGNVYECTTKLEERHIYGSSRLGLNKKPNENKHKFSASIGQNGMFDFITNQPAEYPNGPGQAKMIGGSGTIALYHDTAQSYTLELYTEHPIKISSTAMAGFSITEGNGTWITTDTFLTDAAQKITIEALDTLYLFSTFEEMFGYMEYSSAKTTKLKGGSISMGGPLLPIFVKNYSKTAGEKAYELVSHLGNVHMVISDRKVSVEDGSSGNVAYFVSDVISTNDVYPFGSLLPQRNFSSEKYRYGWNKGSEKDDEITGVVGAHITTFFREYDTRLGRTWTLDPVFQPWQSSYTSMDNNPIWFNDPMGNTVEGTTKDDAGKAVEDIKTILPESIVSDFFTIGDDGKTFNKIGSTNALNKALRESNASKGQKVLAHMLKTMINSKAKFKVSYVDEGISRFEAESATEGTAYISKSSYMGPNAHVYTSTDGQPMTPNRAQLFVHELLGEGFYSAMGTKDLRTAGEFLGSFKTNEARLEDKAYQKQVLRIIQVENLYNSINGVFRSGLTHGVHIKDLGKVKDVPKGLTPYLSPGFFGQGNTP